MIRFITDEQLYRQVIEPVSSASKFVWIGTADIKDLHVRTRNAVQPFLAVLNSLAKRKIAIRLLHAKEPGPNFRNTFDKYPALWEYMEWQLCPRVHFKQFDEVWMGSHCKTCRRKQFCSDPIL